jgi:hypothetical protein
LRSENTPNTHQEFLRVVRRSTGGSDPDGVAVVVCGRTVAVADPEDLQSRGSLTTVFKEAAGIRLAVGEDYHRDITVEFWNFAKKDERGRNVAGGKRLKAGAVKNLGEPEAKGEIAIHYQKRRLHGCTAAEQS